MKKRILILFGSLMLSGLLLFFFTRDPVKDHKALAESRQDAVASPPRVATAGSEGKEEGKGGQSPAETVQEQAGDIPVVNIPPDRQQLIGVKIAEVSERPLQTTIQTVGRIEYDERKLVTVNIKVEGYVDKLYADYAGKHVRKGDPLADIYSPELYATQMEYINLLKWRKDKARSFQRSLEFSWGDRYNPTGRMLTSDIDSLVQVAQQRFRLWDVTDEQVKKIEETLEPFMNLTVRSPVNGYVIQKAVVKGTRVGPGEKLFDIADLSSVWVIADMYQSELSFVKPGQKARISLSYMPGKTFSSTVDYIYPALSAQTRTARVRFTIANPDMEFKPQMFTRVEATIDAGKRLSIPEDAVIDTGSRQVVYVDKGGGSFEPREVILGVRADGFVEVKRGLRSGERVASSAAFMIDSEAKLRGVVTQ